MYLLASWAKRFFTGGGKQWLSLVQHKYLTDKPNLLWSEGNIGSPFLKGFTWPLAGVRPFCRGIQSSFGMMWAGNIS